MGAASALLTAGLGFSVRSGQNTAGLPLLRATQTAAPGLWVSADSFRQRGWRMMGSSWGVRVFLLSPRDGIAGVFLLVLFLMVPVVLLLPWAPSGRCPELLLCGGVGISRHRGFQHYSWLCAGHPSCPGSFPSPSEHQRGSHAQLLLKELFSSLWRFVIPRECFLSAICC